MICQKNCVYLQEPFSFFFNLLLLVVVTAGLECPKRPTQQTHTRAQAGQAAVSTRRVGRDCEAAERGGGLIIHSLPIKCVLSCVGQWGLALLVT